MSENERLQEYLDAIERRDQKIKALEHRVVMYAEEAMFWKAQYEQCIEHADKEPEKQ